MILWTYEFTTIFAKTLTPMSSTLQITLAIIEIVILFLSPFIAVLVTLWYQDRQAKQQVKMDLFRRLITHKGKVTLSREYIEALNQIRVVFYNNEKIKTLWGQYYELVQVDRDLTKLEIQRMDRIDLDMLQEIAKELKFKDMTQNDISRHYYPSGLGQQDEDDIITKSLMKRFYIKLLNDQNASGAEDTEDAKATEVDHKA